jgi:hypothetical protein
VRAINLTKYLGGLLFALAHINRDRARLGTDIEAHPASGTAGTDIRYGKISLAIQKIALNQDLCGTSGDTEAASLA